MADSDGEYVEDLSDEDEIRPVAAPSTAQVESNYGTRSKGEASSRRDRTKQPHNDNRRRAAWEDMHRSWEDVIRDDKDGKAAYTIDQLIDEEKRRRLLRDTTPLQRGIIRHLMLVIDMSFAMLEKDLLPTRYYLTLNYAVEFVREYFEQNPISQLGIVGMRDGVAVRISEMSGNPAEHIEQLRRWHDQETPSGHPSLQNALEMCRGALFHAPSHGTREVLIIYGALLSSDPNDIHDTIAALIADRIRVSIIGLSAQVAICAELCSRTNGGDDSTYAVVLHEHHFRELFLKATTPPPTLKSAPGAITQQTPAAALTQNGSAKDGTASLLMMGFPSRALAPRDVLTVCACHNKPSREGYACTRCRAKVCRLPSECPACGLTLILSTHLARSYHHLFPLRLWVEVSWAEAARSRSVACFSCLAPFQTRAGDRAAREAAEGKQKAAQSRGKERDHATPQGVSESGRYKCRTCRNHFCIDCDVFAHEVLHNCPGCQSDTRGRPTGRSEDMEVTLTEQTVAAADAGNRLNANGHSVLRDDLGSGQPDGFLAPQVG
ncbi:putative transcription factor [Coniochaeta ligniaria NRRL 30616]|uniref:Putative transcription factor n=1 Tax=Coniochaeta ligniaria NRRL 30616 TaxID=1408157 RepID=A0A1J7JCB0_9PEZI|nr:putative transcription factor [Coniochaeta ligniaria NRRL 30616]